jgi:Cu+-exporting ATPase
LKSSHKSKLLSIIGTAENSSEHPLGQAVVRYAKSVLNVDLLGKCTQFSAVPGRGLKATVSKIEQLSKIQLNTNDIYVQTDHDFNSSLDKTLG